MKDVDFLLLSDEQRDFWNFKFRDKVKFPRINIVNGMFMLFLINEVLLLSYLLIQENFMKRELATSLMLYLKPIILFMFFAWVLDHIVAVIICFYWRKKERIWLNDLRGFL